MKKTLEDLYNSLSRTQTMRNSLPFKSEVEVLISFLSDFSEAYNPSMATTEEQEFVEDVISLIKTHREFILKNIGSE